MLLKHKRPCKDEFTEKRVRSATNGLSGDPKAISPPPFSLSVQHLLLPPPSSAGQDPAGEGAYDPLSAKAGQRVSPTSSQTGRQGRGGCIFSFYDSLYGREIVVSVICLGEKHAGGRRLEKGQRDRGDSFAS